VGAAQHPRHHCLGLIEAQQSSPDVRQSHRQHPRHHCLGLIEATPTPGAFCWSPLHPRHHCLGLIEAGSALAPSTPGGRIRGITASASLKHLKRHLHSSHSVSIRGITASASLKQENNPDRCRVLGPHPRHHCLGLIEARPCQRVEQHLRSASEHYSRLFVVCSNAGFHPANQ